jgi:U3 small nucleolar RNA-associated protein MPP10
VRLVGEHVAALVEKQKDLPTAPKSNGLHKGEAVESDVDESIEEEGSDSEDELTNESENETEGQLEDDSEVSEEQEEDKEDEDKEDKDREDEDKEDEDKDRDEDGSLDDDEFPEIPEADKSDEDMDMPASTSKPFKRDAHDLNDQFFSIDDFNRLTELQDAADSDLGDDEIDYFGGTHFPPNHTNSRSRRTSLGF